MIIKSNLTIIAFICNYGYVQQGINITPCWKGCVSEMWRVEFCVLTKE